jgi:hypothetical protein
MHHEIERHSESFGYKGTQDDVHEDATTHRRIVRPGVDVRN